MVKTLILNIWSFNAAVPFAPALSLARKHRLCRLPNGAARPACRGGLAAAATERVAMAGAP
jgi:hypothetical protein